MKDFISKLSALALLPLLIFSVSCVNQKYEISEDKIDLEVTVFQEGVVVPLGSTEAIRIKDIVSQLDDEYRKYLEARENGVYSIYYADSYDLSDSLAVMKEMLKIEDIAFAQDIEFSLSDVDMSEVKIKEFSESYEESLADAFEVPSIPNFTIDESYEYGTELYTYALSSKDKTLNIDPIEHRDYLIALENGYEVPSGLINDTPVSIQQFVNLTGITADLADKVGPEIYEVNVKMSFPEGIRSIQEVVLKESSRVRLTANIGSSLFTGGTINPHLDIDVHEIFHLSDGITADHIIADFEMPASGGEISREYGVESVVFNDEDWVVGSDGRLQLNKTIDIAIEGYPVYNDVVTTTRHISEHQSGRTPVEVKVEFVDFEIDYVKAAINPITVENNENAVLELDPIVLPEGIKDVEYVEFADDSKVEFSLSVDNLEKVEGLELEVEYLEFTIPEGMVVTGAENGRLVYEHVNLADGFEGELRIEKYDLPEPVEGTITPSGQISVKAKTVASGTVSTKDLPETEADDLRLKVSVKGSMEVSDYCARIDGYDYHIDIAQHIEEEIPEALSGIGEAVIYPEGDPVIEIDVALPETSLPLGPVNDGLVITLPQMLKLKSLPAEYNYDTAANTITFRDVLPSHIELPIDCLVLSPVKVEDKYFIMGDMSVTGSVGIAACEVHKTDVDALVSADAKVSMTVHIPELVPASFSLDQYVADITQEVEFTLLEPDQIPEEIVSAGRIDLEDVYVNLLMDASSLPDTGNAGLELDFAVSLPELLVLGDGLRDESGLVHIKGSLDKDRRIVIDPIKVEALELSGVDLHAEKALVEKVAVDGTVKLTDAELDIDEWMDKDHSVTFEASIKDIKIARITGKVDVGIDPVAETIELAEVKSLINTDNIQTTIDLEHVHLAVDLETNLGISAKANAKIVPYYDGAPAEAIDVALEVKAAASAAQPRKTSFWLGDKAECCPEGYEFKEIPILDLIRNIPDSIQVNVTAGTDPNEECVLEPSADYLLKLDYALDIPMRLGDDFKFEFRDTLSGIPPVISTIFRSGNLILAGEIESSLPFELDLKAVLLDEDGNVIRLAEGSGLQVIKGCTVDGSPVKTDLYLKMAKNEDESLPEISAVELNFAARSSGSGAPITDETFIKATLHALVPDGIHVDLRDFMNDNAEEVQ